MIQYTFKYTTDRGDYSYESWSYFFWLCITLLFTAHYLLRAAITLETTTTAITARGQRSGGFSHDSTTT